VRESLFAGPMRNSGSVWRSAFATHSISKGGAGVGRGGFVQFYYLMDTARPTPPSTARCARQCAGKVEDLRESRLVVCDPSPIPADEMQRTFDWLKSWGMLEETASPLQLVNADVQTFAHVAAE